MSKSTGRSNGTGRATSCFASADHLAKFKANPEKWAPQYGGWRAYAMAQGRRAKTEPEVFTLVDGKLYMNYGLSIMKKKWRANQADYIEKGNANWPKLENK